MKEPEQPETQARHPSRDEQQVPARSDPLLLKAIGGALAASQQQAQLGALLAKLLAGSAQHAAGAAQLAAQARSLLARARDLRPTTESVREAIDRTRIIALNAGLEGSRLSEADGRALLIVGEEIRGAATQGERALDELMSLLAQVDSDRQALCESAERLSEQQQQHAARFAELHAQQARLASELDTLVATLGDAAGTDPELARLSLAAQEQAQGLLGLLGQIRTHPGAEGALASVQGELESLWAAFGKAAPARAGGDP